MQLNVPIPGGGAFFISNVGAATSKGVELELGVRQAYGVDLFAALGITRARFGGGSLAMGVDVDGNDVPGTPEYTASAGAQLTRQIVRSWAWFVRGEAARWSRSSIRASRPPGSSASPASRERSA